MSMASDSSQASMHLRHQIDQFETIYQSLSLESGKSFLLKREEFFSEGT